LRTAATLFDNRAVARHSRSQTRTDISALADNRTKMLRALPSIDETIRAVEASPALAGLGRVYLKLMVQRAQAELRAAIVANRPDLPHDREAILASITREVERADAADRPKLRPVVNATGVVLHTNLGRAILAERAIEAVEQAARAPLNLEYDLETGGRGDRDTLVEEEICALTGAEAATVVNNNAAAVVLALNSLAQNKEVVVSRGEMIEIGGSFRLPDVMSKSGAILKEVGTTNRTHPSDYADAIGPETALLMKVHPSNFRVVGFTSEVTLENLVEIATERGIDVLEDLGSGALVDLGAFGIPREPIVSERIAAGAAIVTFSGDKLLGGPQAGVIVGRRALIEKIRRNPLKRALRCDKLTLAALSATLRIYLRSPDIAAELPTLRLLGRSAAAIRAIAPRARDILAERLGSEFSIEIVPTTSEVGSGALPVKELESVALQVGHCELSANAIAAMFRRAAIIGRIANDAFILDLRTVEDPNLLAVEFERN
jgi:L-seryl-tRNA(Ser) seleniumtransferase